MTYAPVTAFLRPINAVQLARAQAAVADDGAISARSINKWETLRELIAGRAAFGLSDRDLAVLEALVSFHPGASLGGDGAAPVVHPSNAAICERLKGMACSTMRRHLARLVDAGLVARRDSPNGKRYARRYGDETVVFGFDLTPLLTRHAEICAAAETARARTEHLTRLRETVSLMRRDLAGLASYGATLRPDLDLWAQISDLAALIATALRRKPQEDTLEAMKSALAQALDTTRDILEPRLDTRVMGTNVALSGQHYENSKTDSLDLEPCLEKARGAASAPLEEPADPVETVDRNLPNIPLGLVLSACHEIHGYAAAPIRHWHDLVKAADLVRPMTGISPSAWAEARAVMGPEQAAVVIAAMLERFSEIRSPGGYLRNLTIKAEKGAFSCGPMVMALMRKVA